MFNAEKQVWVAIIQEFKICAWVKVGCNELCTEIHVCYILHFYLPSFLVCGILCSEHTCIATGSHRDALGLTGRDKYLYMPVDQGL